MHHHRHGHRDGVISGASAVRYVQVVSRWVLPPLYRAVATDVATVAPQDGAVLDVGTGPGRLLVELARRRPDLSLAGVDPSEDMIAAAKQYLPGSPTSRTQVLVAAAEDLPFPERSVDVVVSTLSAHHWSDLGRGLAEQARVLRPGGQVRVYDLRGPAKGLQEHCEAAGLTVVPEAPTGLSWFLRLLLTAVVAVKRPTGEAST